MNELGAKLDRVRCLGIRDGEDAAADAIAGLDDFDIDAGLMQRTCRGKACRARTDYDDHAVNVLRPGP